ncbi:MAG: hypothetical protein IPL89_16130 [Acidobacteria bacterium]|nr:hypothetical protein [Acidobacteriota bacterium]
MGNAGDFVIKPTPDGYIWEIPAGPMTIPVHGRHQGRTLKGSRRPPRRPARTPVRFFEMTLTRIGDTTWPAGGAVPPK